MASASVVLTVWNILMLRNGCKCKCSFNTLRPRQNVRHFPDDIFIFIFLNENAWSLINISLKFVPQAQINNIPALVHIMAWRRPGDKPLSEPMMFSLLTHISYFFASLGLNEFSFPDISAHRGLNGIHCIPDLSRHNPGHVFSRCLYDGRH